MKKETKIELRSEKVRNLLGEIPPSLVRWGAGCRRLYLEIVLLARIRKHFLKYEFCHWRTADIAVADKHYSRHIIFLILNQAVFLRFRVFYCPSPLLPFYSFRNA